MIKFFKKKKKTTYSLLGFVLMIIIFILSSYFLLPGINPIPSSTILYDRNNVEIGEIPYENKYRFRPIKYEEIPEFYKKCLISIEDKTFFTNPGISLSGLLRSTYNNLKNRNITEGGSTISSQLIRNVFWLNERRSLTKKILEFYYAIGLNLKFSKEKILKEYVNRLYFGYMNYGIKSASIYYFNKDLNNLTKAEQIALLTIEKNATKYDPYRFKNNFDNRFGVIVSALHNNGIITNEEMREIKVEKLVFNTDHKDKLPYISDFYEKVLSNKYNFINNNINSKLTIDYELSKKIEEIGDNAINDLAWKNVKDYGVLLLDKKTNNLLVMIGGKNYYSTDGQVNSTLALRQPGSTIKPFTYLLASKILNITPNDTILDLPVLYKTKDDYSYEPKNYSTKFEGEVSVGEALAQSMNVPAVKMLEKIGVNTLLKFLQDLGIKSLREDAEHYGLALTLGDGEVSLYELTRAYSIFANNGKFCDINFNSNGKNDCKQVFQEKHINEINYILSSRYLKLGGYPINSTLDFSDINVFFKTGTSRNYRDNWTVGYTDNYIIGVWAGNKDATNMKGVSGATGAGEIFGRIVRFLEKPTKKEDTIDIKVNKTNYLEITVPLNGQKYKINQFTSSDKQKVKLLFSTNIYYDKYFWFLDGEKVGGDFINLKTGKHKLNIELLKDGEIVGRNSIDFEVMGEE